jgi:hypothetical protein
LQYGSDKLLKQRRQERKGGYFHNFSLPLPALTKKSLNRSVLSGVGSCPHYRY